MRPLKQVNVHAISHPTLRHYREQRFLAHKPIAQCALRRLALSLFLDGALTFVCETVAKTTAYTALTNKQNEPLSVSFGLLVSYYSPPFFCFPPVSSMNLGASSKRLNNRRWRSILWLRIWCLLLEQLRWESAHLVWAGDGNPMVEGVVILDCEKSMMRKRDAVGLLACCFYQKLSFLIVLL